jgi:hypothetical protein
VNISATLVEHPTPETLSRAVRKAGASGSVVLFLLGDGAGMDLHLLHERLCSLDIPFAGAVVPGVIWKDHVYAASALVCGFPRDSDMAVVCPLVARSADLPVGIMRWKAREGAAALVLLDGLSAGISDFLWALSDYLGPEVTFIGGGAAYSDFVQRPCLLTRAGVFCNGAVVLRVQTAVKCAVRHGWSPVGQPLIITRSTGNTVHELNWRTAFNVYREALLAVCGKHITRENFAALSRQHPLGIIREGAEHLVRDPIAVDREGSLVCVGAMPENATVHVMEGHPDSLIRAAAQVAREALAATPAAPSLLWIADCISRREFLGDKFTEELRAVSEAAERRGLAAGGCGFLSFGEVAALPGGGLNFHNKTIVMAAFHE